VKKIIMKGDDIVLDARMKKGPPAPGKRKP